jgi:hypothetical protein
MRFSRVLVVGRDPVEELDDPLERRFEWPEDRELEIFEGVLSLGWEWHRWCSPSAVVV